MPDPREVPVEVAECLAEQLGITDTSVLAEYGERAYGVIRMLSRDGRPTPLSGGRLGVRARRGLGEGNHSSSPPSSRWPLPGSQRKTCAGSSA
jgi:hypothetical protein